MRTILNIVRTILRESVRNKLFWGFVLFLIIFFGFSAYIGSLSLNTPARFIQNAGMAGISLVCLAVTILFGLYSLYEEKSRRELYVMLNRTPRSIYLLGRFAGSVLIQTIFALLTASGIFLLTWGFGNAIRFEIFAAAYWAILEFSLLMAIGLLFYSFDTGFTLNALLVIATYVAGHSTKEAVLSFVGLGRYGSDLHLYLVKTISIILPDFDFFNFRLALVHQEKIPAGKILLSTGYWVFYLAGVLTIAAVLFKKKDI